MKRDIISQLGQEDVDLEYAVNERDSERERNNNCARREEDALVRLIIRTAYLPIIYARIPVALAYPTRYLPCTGAKLLRWVLLHMYARTYTSLSFSHPRYINLFA